jgi:hypothetical protein
MGTALSESGIQTMLALATVERVQDGATAFSGEKLPIFKTTWKGKMVFVTYSAASSG